MDPNVKTTPGFVQGFERICPFMGGDTQDGTPARDHIMKCAKSRGRPTLPTKASKGVEDADARGLRKG